jgi:hypothetical protein
MGEVHAHSAARPAARHGPVGKLEAAPRPTDSRPGGLVAEADPQIAWDGHEELSGVRVVRPRERGSGRTELDDVPVQQDSDRVADVPDDGQVV